MLTCETLFYVNRAFASYAMLISDTVLTKLDKMATSDLSRGRTSKQGCLLVRTVGLPVLLCFPFFASFVHALPTLRNEPTAQRLLPECVSLALISCTEFGCFGD